MNRVVVITGVSSGIGLELAKKFIASNDIVYGISRKKFELKNMNHIICDVSVPENCEDAIKQVKERENRIDIIINNAGMGIAGSVENTPIENAKKIYDVNFFGTFYMCKYALPLLRESKGKIINVSSVASKLPIPFQAFYSATKASIDAISAGIRAEAKEFGVQVATVMPGDTKTGFTGSREKQFDGVYENRFINSVSRMEKDEQNGMTSEYVARVIYKLANKKKMPHSKTAGISYKFFVFLAKVLPNRLVEFIVSKLYA